ncbi:MAG: IS630 family transposase [Bacteroidales bacterium]
MWFAVLRIAPGAILRTAKSCITIFRFWYIVIFRLQALAVHTGEITARNIERNNASNFLKFLKLLDRKYRNVEIHIILDNLSVHKNKDVKEWLNRKRKFHIHYTPTYSSWLNQIETWFSIMTRDVLKDSIWGSKRQLVDELMRYIKMYNTHRAKPFQCTYGNNKIN